MITFKVKGNFKKFNNFLEKAKEVFNVGVLDKYGKMGVEALSKSTPVDTGLTSQSWDYEIRRNGDTVSIVFLNTNIQNGCNVALMLATGHATRSGYWVEGIDYLTPALRPIFEEMAKNALKEATKK